ncbi:hypothetical protein [Parageobacillus thermoglucosidasius]|uniref:hypothetical protein n=1 Tax=Parageobacillus thermoglucosidasius TaxID=1426 RepID=UPI002E212B2E|nr:hypothetical protein [Parageobacillus thermoglucosidasius]
MPMAIRLEPPKPGARSIRRSVVQADSFRSHTKRLQVAAHRIAAGSFQATNKASNKTIKVYVIE